MVARQIHSARQVKNTPWRVFQQPGLLIGRKFVVANHALGRDLP
jgi:hypothetical protein